MRLSPKKQATAKCLANAQLKSSQVRKTGSPNAKKMPSTGCKSPNSKKTTSPVSSAPENLESISPPQDSNAIQTAKKLKRFLEACEPTPPSSQSAETDRTNATASNAKTKLQQSHMLSKPIKKQKRAHEYHDSGDEAEHAEESTKKDDTKVVTENETQKDIARPDIQWTREEDRLLLEQIKAGLDSNAEDITGFAQQFPNKTEEQIKDRLDFLIDFLTKLRNKQ